MIKLVKRMSLWSVFAAVVFMIVQIIADLYLPTLTSNIINDGVAKGDINYIWSTGVVMLGFSLISIVASIGNTFFATKESQSLGKKLLIFIEKLKIFLIMNLTNLGQLR